MQAIEFKILNEDVGLATKSWIWPQGDDKTVCCFEHVYDIDEWARHCKGFDVAVQAGGAMGVFPLKLSTVFNRVYTFEPNPESYFCLVENCRADNVIAKHGALSNVHKTVSIERSIGERRNYGAGYIVDDADGVDTYLIDELDLTACDLICLDVEGAELDALKGGEQTIKKFKPLIVLEDKPLPHMGIFGRGVGDPGKWLAQFGYKRIAKHRWDSVYSC